MNTLLPAPIRPLYTIPLPASFTTPGAEITSGRSAPASIAFAVAGIGNPLNRRRSTATSPAAATAIASTRRTPWQAFQGFTFSYGASYLYETNLFNHDLSKPALIQPLVGLWSLS